MVITLRKIGVAILAAAALLGGLLLAILTLGRRKGEPGRFDVEPEKRANARTEAEAARADAAEIAAGRAKANMGLAAEEARRQIALAAATKALGQGDEKARGAVAAGELEGALRALYPDDPDPRRR